MPDDEYPPDSIRVLAGLEPSRRDPDDPILRWVDEFLGAGPGEARYPAEDGPGSSVRVELSVSVLVGLERSTVIVADPLTGRALAREVLPHGREADVAAAAVEAAIRARLPGDPGGVAGGSRKPAGEPIE